MKKCKIHLPIYDWDITLVRVENPDDAPLLKKELKAMDVSDADMKEDVDNCKRDAINGGDTWYDRTTRTIVVILFRCKTIEDLFEVFNHEKRHIVDRITETHHLVGTEASAYIDGYISREFCKRRKQLL